jgi:putative transposase
MDVQSVSHTRWECKYHGVVDPEVSKKDPVWGAARYLGPTFRDLAMQKERQVIEGHPLPDHIHKLISIPRKYAVAQVVGCLKGKSAIHIARTYMDRKNNFTGQHFWARG